MNIIPIQYDLTLEATVSINTGSYPHFGTQSILTYMAAHLLLLIILWFNAQAAFCTSIAERK